MPVFPFPDIDNQQYTEKTLKGFLLKNIDLATNNPTVQMLNKYLINRVDHFYDIVVIPLQKENAFDGNKINWYFDIYKEGYEAHRVIENPFPFLTIDDALINRIVEFFKPKTLQEYIELGTSFLSNSYMLLSSWYRDKLVIERFTKIYSSDNPLDWIRIAENDADVLNPKLSNVDDVQKIIQNIGLLMSKRV